ncbi:MAG: sugar phosphate isomerase/epimerase family protein [Planctomycetota bacterium]
MNRNRLQRRDFHRACVQGVAATAMLGGLASERIAVGRGPIARSGPAAIRLGLSAYSLRPMFRFFKGRLQSQDSIKTPLTILGFLDFCRDLHVEASELTGYFLPPASEQDPLPSDHQLKTIRRAAFERGLTISGTAIGNNFTGRSKSQLDDEIALAKRWIRKAAVLGAPHVRLFAGKSKELSEDASRLTQAIDAIAVCADVAADCGIMLGIENHGGLDGDQMLAIMRAVQSPWVGMNLDTGNFHTEDPYRDIERCLPYAVNIQVKTEMKSPDRRVYPADLDRIGKLVRESGYQGFAVLEYEGDDDGDRMATVRRAMDDLRSRWS